MLSILQSFIDIIVTLINLVVSIITSLVSLIINIPTYLSLLLSSVNVLPAFILPFSIAYITLIVVQYIVGRRPS